MARAEVSLAGVPAAVTGGGHGIGRAIAEHLVRAGARVAVGDIDADAADTVARGAGGGAIGLALDVTDADAFATFLDTAEQAHGPLGVMVNNAGIDWIGPFHDEPDEVTRRELSVNLYGTILGSKLALARMLPRGRGHLVNIASGVGRVPLPGSATYSATKHGVVGLTESLRLEYRGSGVDFTVVQPAQVDTAMLDGQARPRALPVVTADDVAEAVLIALRRRRFEVWVPGSQAATAKLAALLPRRAREALMRAIGVTRIAGDTDLEARREYHDRAFGRR
ncbi:MAG TPA: SDR family NAD(P)-dependent oxidoreductase [Solirubrobacteraceae bacterium]|nr:SDR family NAD(P)-dependent oxidoreductase [Solirubrobacteraceae bacterium]